MHRATLVHTKMHFGNIIVCPYDMSVELEVEVRFGKEHGTTQNSGLAS